MATYVLPETAQTYTLGGQRLTHSFFCRFIQSLESLLYTTSQMDGIHGEDPRQASGVPPWFEKVPLPFVHEPNLGNEKKELNLIGLFLVEVSSCTLLLIFGKQVIEYSYR